MPELCTPVVALPPHVRTTLLRAVSQKTNEVSGFSEGLPFRLNLSGSFREPFRESSFASSSPRFVSVIL